MTIQEKFLAVIEALSRRNIGRRTEIEVLALALAIGGTHVQMIGLPGTGKTRLAKQLLSMIGGAKLFSILMGKSTDLADVRGPMSLPDYENGRLVYLTKDFLPAAKVGLLDEVWRGPDPVNNHLLGIMNEGEMTNDGKVVPVETSMVVGCANDYPGDHLGAIKDRYLFRLDVAEIEDLDLVMQIVRLYLDERLGRSTPIVPLIDWSDVEAAQAEIAAMPISDAALDALREVFRQLKYGPDPTVENPDPVAPMIQVSNRREAQCVKVIQGRAWMDGATEAGVEHLDMLVHVLWDLPEQREEVERIVYGICSPNRALVLSLTDQLVALTAEVERAIVMPVRDDAGKPNEARAAVNAELETRLQTMVAELDAAPGAGPVAALLDDLAKRTAALSQKLFLEGICGGRRQAGPVTPRRAA